MFTHRNWAKLCQNIIKSNRASCKVEDFFQGTKMGAFVCLKHDVEVAPKKALEIAKVESRFKLLGTYYVQANLLDNMENIKILKKIQDLGHEVSYHYDVLDNNNGDWKAAIREFDENVKKFLKHGFKVKTVCPHGNPTKVRKGWNSNKDFFKSEIVKAKFPKILDIVSEFSTLPKGILYISDAGYSFKKISNFATNDKSGGEPDQAFSFFKLKKSLVSDRLMIISIHPHRWEKYSILVRLRLLIFRNLRIVAKSLAKVEFFKNIMNKFYYLAKNI